MFYRFAFLSTLKFSRTFQKLVLAASVRIVGLSLDTLAKASGYVTEIGSRPLRNVTGRLRGATGAISPEFRNVAVAIHIRTVTYTYQDGYSPLSPTGAFILSEFRDHNLFLRAKAVRQSRVSSI
jgi:hypothetical protein